MRESGGLDNCRCRLRNGVGGMDLENRPLAALIEEDVEDGRSGLVLEALGQVYGGVAWSCAPLRAIAEMHVAELGISHLWVEVLAVGK